MSYTYGGLTLANTGDIITQSTVSTNFESVLRNQAGTTAPASPITGQLWYDSTGGVTALKVWSGTAWVVVGGGTAPTTGIITGTASQDYQKSATAPTTRSVAAASAALVEGDLWYNTTSDILQGWSGAAWTAVASSTGLIPRVLASTANSATPTLNTNNFDMMVITGQSVAITSFTTNVTGTPVNGQRLWISITGTTAIAITWGALFEASTTPLPTTTVTTARLDVGFVWNVATSKWRCVASA